MAFPDFLSLMEFAPEGLRSVYAGIVNSLLAPTLLVTPIIGGYLVDAFGYSAVFKATLLINAIGVVIFLALVQDPRTLQRDDMVFYQNL